MRACAELTLGGPLNSSLCLGSACLKPWICAYVVRMTRWVARVKFRTRGELVSWLLLLSMFAQAVVPAAATPLRTSGGVFSAGADSALAAAPSSAKKRTQLRAATDDGGHSLYLDFDGPNGLAAAAVALSPILASGSLPWIASAVIILRRGLTPFAARAPPTL